MRYKTKEKKNALQKYLYRFLCERNIFAIYVLRYRYRHKKILCDIDISIFMRYKTKEKKCVESNAFFLFSAISLNQKQAN